MTNLEFEPDFIAVTNIHDYKFGKKCNMEEAVFNSILISLCMENELKLEIMYFYYKLRSGNMGSQSEDEKYL